ncbi:MAG TPA: FAD:protein FMN transferase [Jatrophihabitans sp.]|nr:FAD:protein FMN transferase [Jatrophihabitans sp.]
MQVPAGPGVVRFDVAAMGGNAHIILLRPPPGTRSWVVRRLAELEAAWSRFRPDSELSRLNQHAGGEQVVGPDTLGLVRAAIEGWRLTAGRFDPTVHRALIELGYDRDFSSGTGPGTAGYRGRPAPGCEGIRVIDARSAIVLPPGVTLDPGGLGKGLAADLVVAELIERGCAGACANLAGDVRVAGRGPDPRGWVIGIEDPHRAGAPPLATVALDDGAVATSSVLHRRWPGGRHHLVDPRTGLPSDTGYDAVTVIAPTGLLAEVLTKAVLLDGIPASQALLTTQQALALAVDRTGRRTTSRGWPGAGERDEGNRTDSA